MALASYAMDVRESRGRQHSEPPHPYRGDYARDRDRVIHCRAFRRLEAKTQVFTTRYSDHFRNRLTHTIEVAQIARTVAEALGLNTDLAEALALVHDIGHPPFGHAGEHKLDQLLTPHGDSFNHNLQALRIVESLEHRYLDFPGLNLTFELREGIVKHSRDYDSVHFPELSEYLLERQPPLEAQLIDLVDEIAYDTADLDDGYEAKLLDIDMMRANVPLFDRTYEDVERTHYKAREQLKFNETVKRMLDRLATDLIENTRAEATAAGVKSAEDIRNVPRRLAGFSPQIAADCAALKNFLIDQLYNHPGIVVDRERSARSLGELFEYYLAHLPSMPKFFAELAQQTNPARVVCDYIAGMTDHFLLLQHSQLPGPESATSAR